MPHAAVTHALAHRLDQFRQEKKIILKERIARHVPAFHRNAQHHFESALGRRIAAHPSKLLVEPRLGDFTFFDVQHETAVVTDETDVQSLFELVPLAANHDAIAIAVLLRAGNHRLDGAPRKTADALK